VRALTITKIGPPEVLQLRDWPDPELTAGHVVIDVQRAGLNFADVSARVGLYPDAPPPPCVVGYEVSGVVREIGAGIEHLKPGDRVLALCRFKGQATRVVELGSRVVKIPDAMSFDDAAALPVNYLTAYQMLHQVAQLRPNQRVLIHMAAGGVGLAAIQMCKVVPGVVTFGTASASKHALLKEAGYDHPIDYHSQDYAAVVRQLTGGRGVDFVLDALGGPDWHKGYNLLANGGTLFCFGWANMVGGERRNPLRMVSQFLRMPRYAPMQLMDANRSVAGVNLGHLWDEREMIARHFETLLRWYGEGKLKPRIDSVFPLADGAAAHRRIQERKNIGKVLFDCTA
jgi:synaptic vesicle membrane protein VAT-1